MVQELYHNDGDGSVYFNTNPYRDVIIASEAARLYPLAAEYEGALVMCPTTIRPIADTMCDTGVFFTPAPTRAYVADASSFQNYEHHLATTCGMALHTHPYGFAPSPDKFAYVESLLNAGSTAAFPGGRTALDEMITAFSMTTLSGYQDHRVYYVSSNVAAIRSTAAWQTLTSTLGDRVLLVDASIYDGWRVRAWSSHREEE